MAVETGSFELVVERQAGSQQEPLANVWVYVKQGGTLKTLRSNARGSVFSNETGVEESDDTWWDYSSRVKVDAAQVLEVAFSRGARPVPVTQLPDSAFKEVKVGEALAPRVVPRATTTSRKATKVTHSIALRSAIAVLPDPQIQLQSPQELTVLALPFQPLAEDDVYYTNGLKQGFDAWKDGSRTTLSFTEFDPNDPEQFDAAGAPKDTVRAGPPSVGLPTMGFLVRGTIAAGASNVKLRLVDESNAVIDLLEPTTFDEVTELEVELEPSSDDASPSAFGARVFINDGIKGKRSTAPPFGFISLLVEAEFEGTVSVSAFSVMLLGLQLALVNDDDPEGADGRGRVLTAADQMVVVDFSEVSGDSVRSVQDLTRTRRMHTHIIDFEGTDAAGIRLQRMPRLMGEMQFLMQTMDGFRHFMRHRYFLASGGLIDPFNENVSLIIRWIHSVTLEWRARNPDKYQTAPFEARPESTAEAKLVVRHDGALLKSVEPFEPQPENETTIEGALTPETPLVGDLRDPKLHHSQSRVWGMHRESPPNQALVVDVQVPVATVNRDREVVDVLRGGTGVFDLPSLEFEFVEPSQTSSPPTEAGLALLLREPESGSADPVDILLARTSRAEVVEAAIEGVAINPVASSPLFRVGGRNLTQADVETILEEHIRQQLRDNPPNCAGMLHPDCWVETARFIILPEAGGTMFTRSSRQGTFVHPRPQDGVRFGVEAGMPTFGPPSGYGVCQLDPPIRPPDRGTGDDRLWDYRANIFAGVGLLFGAGNSFFANFANGRHYTSVTRSALNRAGRVNSSEVSATERQAAAARWAAIRGTVRGRAIFQRAVVRSFGGGFEFTYFAATNRWDIWCTTANMFFNLHTDRKVARVMAERGEPYTEVVYKEAPLDEAGQATFTSASFGPLVNLAP